jgi:hypothetical protein
VQTLGFALVTKKGASSAVVPTQAKTKTWLEWGTQLFSPDENVIPPAVGPQRSVVEGSAVSFCPSI